MNQSTFVKSLCALSMAVCFGMIGSIPAYGDALPVVEQVQFADALYVRGLYELALDEYLRISREHPELDLLDQVLYRAGESHRRLGNPRAAERFYWRVVNEFSDSAFRERAEFRRAEVLLLLGRDADAYQLFSAFLQDSPTRPELIAAALFYQAEAARNLGRLEAAEELYTEVFENHSESPFAAYAALDLAAIWRLDPERAGNAVQLYERVLADPPTQAAAAEAWFQKGDWLFTLSRYQEAAAAYDRLLADHPDSGRAAEAALQAAWSYYHVGRFADALTLAEAAVEAEQEGDELVEWLYLLANVQRQLLRTEEAQATYAALIELDGRDGEWGRIAAYEKAVMAFRRDDFDDVLELVAAIEPHEDLRVDLYWLLAESYRAVGRVDEAVQYYRLLLDAEPEGELAPRAWFRLAQILQNRRDFAEAARAYRQLATQFPADELAPDAWMAAAFCYGMLERWDDALRSWNELIDQHPRHALVSEALYQTGLVYLQTDRVEQGTETLQRLLQTQPGSRWEAEAHFQIGVIQQQEGEFALAEESFRAALAAEPASALARDVQYRLAVNLHQQGQVAEAADLLEELVPEQGEQMPESLLEWLAVYRLEQGEYPQAAAVAGVLVARATTDAWRQIGYALQGQGWQGQGDVDAAITSFQRSLAQPAETRDGAEAALALARLHVSQEKIEEARTLFQDVARQATDVWIDLRAQAIFGLGEAAEWLEDDSSAARYFLAVGIIFDDQEWVPAALQRAAAALERQGRTDEKERTLAELRERFPDAVQAEVDEE